MRGPNYQITLWLYDRQPVKVSNRLTDQLWDLEILCKTTLKNIVIGVPKRNRTRDTSMVSDTHYATKIGRKGQQFLSIYSQLPPCGHLAITDSSKIPGESYRRLTEINSPYYGLSLLRTYGHFIRSQRHNFIIFSLVIANPEQHLGVFARISGLFFSAFWDCSV